MHQGLINQCLPYFLPSDPSNFALSTIHRPLRRHTRVLCQIHRQRGHYQLRILAAPSFIHYRASFHRPFHCQAARVYHEDLFRAPLRFVIGAMQAYNGLPFTRQRRISTRPFQRIRHPIITQRSHSSIPTVRYPILTRITIFRPRLHIIYHRQRLRLHVLRRRYQVQFRFIIRGHPLIHRTILRYRYQQGRLPTHAMIIRLATQRQRSNRLRTIRLLVRSTQVYSRYRPRLQMRIMRLRTPILINEAFRRRLSNTITRRPSASIRRRRMVLRRLTRFLRTQFLRRRIRLLQFLPQQRRRPIILYRFQIRPRTMTRRIRVQGLLRQLHNASMRITTHGRHTRSLQHPFRSFLVRQRLRQRRILYSTLSTYPTRRQCQHRCLTQQHVTQRATTLSPYVRRSALLPYRPIIRYNVLVLFLPTDVRRPNHAASQARFLSRQIQYTRPLLIIHVRGVIGAFRRVQ